MRRDSIKKKKDQNSYQRELRVQLRFMGAIEMMESILGSTTFVVNICDKIVALRQATIHPEAVKYRWK